MQVIEKHVIYQTDYMYPFYSVYEQEQTMYTFHQNDFINYQ